MYENSTTARVYEVIAIHPETNPHPCFTDEALNLAQIKER
jgi:hypothetical protein